MIEILLGILFSIGWEPTTVSTAMLKTVKYLSIRYVSLSAMDAARITEAISEWFRREQRDLAFRRTRDPYAIMVSEFMLQQTTVAAVLPYYERFLVRFPDVESLAAADEQDVLHMWAGLGYYRRAKQLRAAAVSVMEKHGGQFPESAKELERLPGFGRYTAGAVASQAFDRSEPILEANTVRVFARLPAIAGMVGDGPFMKKLWGVAEHLVRAAESPRTFNMGAMELGAVVCRPVPLCEVCPVREDCAAYASGNPTFTPVMKPRREKQLLYRLILAIENLEGNWLIRQIPEGQWHAGMWEFPTFEISASEDLSDRQVKVVASQELGLSLDHCGRLMDIKYTVTHHSIQAYVFRCTAAVSPPDLCLPVGSYRFASLEDISQLPMGSAQKKVLKKLEGTTRNLANEPY